MAWDPVWENVYRNQVWGQYPGEELIRFIARNFYRHDNRSAIKFLEVGCGPGANCWYLAREGFSFVGIDASTTAINCAWSRLDKECSGWHALSNLMVGDILQLPFPDATFDAVIDVEAIYCNDWQTSQSIYGEMARVLKPSGLMFSQTFAKGSWGDGTGVPAGRGAWLCSEGPLAGKGFSRFTDLDEIPDLIRGFCVRDIELLTRSIGARQNTIKEWIMVGEKKHFKHGNYLSPSK